MFDLPIMLFITAVMTIVQVSVWQMFPRKWKDVMMANPIFAFIINLAGSSLIATFTGIGSIVGVCNMAASVIFGGYAWWYCKKEGIVGLGIDWIRLFKIIPIIPILVVQYEKDGKTWIL